MIKDSMLSLDWVGRTSCPVFLGSHCSHPYSVARTNEWREIRWIGVF